MAQKLIARVLIQSAGRVLAIEHGGRKRDLGLPGGHVEVGETPLDAAARELREETGLFGIDLRPVVVVEDPKRVTFVFQGAAAGVLRNSDEGRARWVSWNELVRGKHGRHYLELGEALSRRPR